MKTAVILVTEKNHEWASAMTGLSMERVRQQYEMDKAAGIVCVLQAPNQGIRNLKDHELGHTAFINGDHTVINLAGENYYRACGHPVREHTTCVKRSNHKNEHEDFYGEKV